MGRQNNIRKIKSRIVKNKHKKDIEKLEEYKILKYETITKSETAKVEFLISTLQKIQKEDLEKTSFDKFCRDNLKMKIDRFNNLIKEPFKMTFEEIENLILYLKTT